VAGGLRLGAEYSILIAPSERRVRSAPRDQRWDVRAPPAVMAVASIVSRGASVAFSCWRRVSTNVSEPARAGYPT